MYNQNKKKTKNTHPVTFEKQVPQVRVTGGLRIPHSGKAANIHINILVASKSTWQTSFQQKSHILLWEER